MSIHPSVSRFDQFGIGAASVGKEDFGHGASVPIGILGLDAHHFAKRQLAQEVAGRLSTGLVHLWSINTEKAYANAFHGYGVAVVNRSGQPCETPGLGSRSRKNEKQRRQ